jgi:hypothetical protein
MLWEESPGTWDLPQTFKHVKIKPKACSEAIAELQVTKEHKSAQNVQRRMCKMFRTKCVAHNM